MGSKVVTKNGVVSFGSIENANQEAPYRLYRKIFKSKAHKLMMEEFGNIVKKYYPNYSDEDISRLYSDLSKSGCTYATMANVIIEQFNNDIKSFQAYFGDEFCNNDGSINYNKLMVDIYACISHMVEIDVHRYDIRKYSSVLEAVKNILNKEYKDVSEATLDLFNSGWSGDGKDKNGMLVFKNRFCTNETVMGSYREIAQKLFNIDDNSMDKTKLETLLKANNMEYKFNYVGLQSKFSGLPVMRTNNLRKWMNKYFDVNNINLGLETVIVESSNISYNDFLKDIYTKLDEGYSIDVSSPLKADVWMSDGKEWVRPTEDSAGHQMNFEGFDKDGNILVCSWGKTYMFPKEFYQKLEFMAIKLSDGNKDIKRGI